jgi:peroxiredoxin family protein
MSTNKISIIALSGKREQLQMAAMIASVGAVSGNEVHVFLSMNALTYFKKGNSDRAPAEGPMGQIMETKNVPPFKVLFQQAVELGGAKIYACSMAMDVLDLREEDLEEYVAETMGLTMFLDQATGGQVWSF